MMHPYILDTAMMFITQNCIATSPVERTKQKLNQHNLVKIRFRHAEI